MSWFKSTLRSSLHAIFSTGSPAPAAAPSPGEQMATIEEIRQAMLALVSDEGGDRHVGLARRIRYSGDLQALWFMRGELMGLLARTHGEAAAREMIEEVSAMFTDLLPRGLRSRPSPLSGTYRTERFGSDEP